MDQKKLPSMQWYPGDWRKDPTVQALDYFDRGVWFELLNILWDSPNRGCLVLPNGAPMPDAAIARTLSLDLDAWKGVRERLVTFYGTASEGPTDEYPDIAEGVLWSRRQVRDERVRRARAAAGRKGGKASGRTRRGSSKATDSDEAKRQQTPKQTRSKTRSVENAQEASPRADPEESGSDGDEANAKQTTKQNRTSSSSSSSSEAIQPSSSTPGSGRADPSAEREKGEHTEGSSRIDPRVWALARENLHHVRSGLAEVVVHETPIGIGLDLRIFAQVCADHPDVEDELIAQAIRHLPAAVEKPPPLTLGLWLDEDDGEGNLSRCIGLAQKHARPAELPDGIEVDLPGLPSTHDPNEAQRQGDAIRNFRAVVERLREEANP